jgi:hypothetical protein
MKNEVEKNALFLLYIVVGKFPSTSSPMSGSVLRPSGQCYAMFGGQKIEGFIGRNYAVIILVV